MRFDARADEFGKEGASQTISYQPFSNQTSSETARTSSLESSLGPPCPGVFDKTVAPISPWTPELDLGRRVRDFGSHHFRSVLHTSSVRCVSSSTFGLFAFRSVTGWLGCGTIARPPSICRFLSQDRFSTFFWHVFRHYPRMVEIAVGAVLEETTRTWSDGGNQCQEFDVSLLQPAPACLWRRSLPPAFARNSGQFCELGGKASFPASQLT